MSASPRDYGPQGYLDDFHRLKRFPAIHDKLFLLVNEEATGRGFLDLCGSTGLLGARLKLAFPRARVLTIDKDADALARGRLAGIPQRTVVYDLGPKTVARLADFVRDNDIEVVVARRCLSELFKFGPGFVQAFADALHAGGAKQIFAEGHRRSRSPCPLPSIDDEVAALEATSRYRVAIKRGECALFVAT